MIEVEQKTQKAYQLNTEAQEFIKNGSYEANIFSQIPDEGIFQADLMVPFLSLLLDSRYLKANYLYFVTVLRNFQMPSLALPKQ